MILLLIDNNDNIINITGIITNDYNNGDKNETITDKIMMVMTITAIITHIIG